MLPLSNSIQHPIDPIENAIKVYGEDDSVFNNNDYILFYAEGPNGYNSESNTNLNLYSDKTAYYINIGSSPGKRILENIQPDNPTNTVINTYTSYKYHEIDEYYNCEVLKLKCYEYKMTMELENHDDDVETWLDIIHGI